MPTMNDAARMMAASDGTGMDMGPAPDPGQVDAVTNADQQDPVADMAGALDMLEGACSAMPEEIQEKMRTHIEALRGLTEEAAAAKSQGGQEAPPQEAAGPEAGPPPTPGPGEKGEMA